MERKEQLRTDDEMVIGMTQILKKQHPNLMAIKNSSIHKVRSMSILNDEFTRHYNIKELTIDILIEISCQYYKLEQEP